MNTFNRTFIVGLLGIAFTSLTAFADNVPPLSITNVIVAGDRTAMVINGVNFDNGGAPVVGLGNVGPLDVTDATGAFIMATLPEGLPSGDYRLSVNTGKGDNRLDEYDLTIGGDAEVDALNQAICDLQVPAGDALLESCPSKVVFVTESVTTGDFGATTDPFVFADGACQSEAGAAGLSGNYLAWLSIHLPFPADPRYISPATRFAQSTVPYVLPVSRSIVARHWNELVSTPFNPKSLLHAIDEQANGVIVTVNDVRHAWTGTFIDGTPRHQFIGVAEQCFDNLAPVTVFWGSAENIRRGTNGSVLSRGTPEWTDAGELPCDFQARFYCFEQ